MSSAYYRSLKRDREKRLRDFRKRKNQLEDIRRNLSGAFENNASDINGRCGKVREKIQDAIHISGGSVTASTMWLNSDLGNGDSDMYSCYTSVCKEHSRVCQEIRDLEREISRLERSIQREEERERQEAIEKLKKTLGVG